MYFFFKNSDFWIGILPKNEAVFVIRLHIIREKNVAMIQLNYYRLFSKNKGTRSVRSYEIFVEK